MTKYPNLLAPLPLALSMLAVGCTAEAIDSSESTSTAPILRMGSDTDPNVIATLEYTEIESLITMHRGPDNIVVLDEVLPDRAPSRLDFLMQQDATALEIVLAAATDDIAIPEILELNHDLMTADRGDREPRVIALSPSPTDVTLRSVSGSTSYTDCSFAADGPDFFDGFWQGAGWNYHWYYYSTKSRYAEVEHLVPRFSTRLRSHICVARGVGGHKVETLHLIGDYNHPECPTQQLYARWGLPEHYRNLVYVNGTNCAHRSTAYFNAATNLPVTMSLGVTQP